MCIRGAFFPVPAPLATTCVMRAPVLAPARGPLDSFIAGEAVIRRRCVRRRARVRLVPCAVAEPPAKIASRGGGKAPSKGLSAPKMGDRALQADSTIAGSNAKASSDSSEPHVVVRGNATSFRVGMPHTSETRKKISAANKGKVPWNKGRKHSEETKRKIADATRRAMKQPETRARLKSIATGRTHSPATKRKIASACVRSRSGHGSLQSDGSRLENGERQIVFGSTMYVAKKELRVPFIWAPDTVSALNLRIHSRACGDEFKKFQKSSAARDRGRRAMSAETRAKLSARIKELWADPDYRARVRDGVKRVSRERGSERSRLTDAHREKIRQSLLKRNARLRGDKATARRPQSRTRTPGGVRSDLVGSKLAGQVVSDEYGDYLASCKEDDSSREDQRKVERQKSRTVKGSGKQYLVAKRCEVEQRAEDGLLLEALASAGQLPPLSEKSGASLVSGLPSQCPDVFGNDGTYQAGAGVLPEAVDGSLTPFGKKWPKGNRLIFSSGDISYLEESNADAFVDSYDGDTGYSSPAVSVQTGSSDNCDNVALESEEDVETLLAEVANAESANSSSFVSSEAEFAVAAAEEVEYEGDDLWNETHLRDAITVDTLGLDSADSAARGSLETDLQDLVDETLHEDEGLSVKPVATERQESGSAVASNSAQDDRKRVVTYVDGVAQFLIVD